MKNADLEIERMLAGLGLVSSCVVLSCLVFDFSGLELCILACLFFSCRVIAVFSLADAIGNRGGGGKFNALPQVRVRVRVRVRDRGWL